jgi:hypothetical protein
MGIKLGMATPPNWPSFDPPTRPKGPYKLDDK